MTDRHAGYIVTLDRDVRKDDAEAIITALKMVKGVIGVEPVEAHAEAHIATKRAELTIRDRVLKALWPEEQPHG